MTVLWIILGVLAGLIIFTFMFVILCCVRMFGKIERELENQIKECKNSTKETENHNEEYKNVNK